MYYSVMLLCILRRFVSLLRTCCSSKHATSTASSCTGQRSHYAYLYISGIHRSGEQGSQGGRQQNEVAIACMPAYPPLDKVRGRPVLHLQGWCLCMRWSTNEVISVGKVMLEDAIILVVGDIALDKLLGGHFYYCHLHMPPCPHELPLLLLSLSLSQSITVPLQGFLNAIVYGWTRNDFVHAVRPDHVNVNNADNKLYKEQISDPSGAYHDSTVESENLHARADRDMLFSIPEHWKQWDFLLLNVPPAFYHKETTLQLLRFSRPVRKFERREEGAKWLKGHGLQSWSNTLVYAGILAHFHNTLC